MQLTLTFSDKSEEFKMCQINHVVLRIKIIPYVFVMPNMN